ncbi:MAG: hypothetical protein JWQ90_992 [Hydrocarboniphaga sp.]|uniref:hypothetical protein n=1 Tax=Hydrocarboniphaga sp. TaxID=2033016 RepID=UPI002611F830|nr:hypothetical protein [Hydrocarboniphaga sp.]MDB5968542.1 hypothetical protein [Hydrocarboniphaga sp.]
MAKRKAGTGIADALLDAHVAFVLEQLTGDALAPLLEEGLDALLLDAGKLKLKDVVTPKMIKDTTRTYAVELQFAGGLPELVGDIARALHGHKIHEATMFGDLVSDRALGEFIDKLLEFKSLREKIAIELFSGPLYAEFASDLLYHGIQGYLSNNPLTRNIPGAGSMMKLGKRVMNKASPGLESSLEDGLKKYIGRSVEATSRRSVDYLLHHIDDDAIREMMLDIWERVRELPVASLREDIGSLDQEELFVIGYEHFQELRRTDFFSTLIDAGIDSFFDKYGNATLLGLIDDIGISRQMMIGEALRYAPPILKTLKKKKMLDATLRRYLEPFYRSGAVEKIIAASS